MPAKKPTKSKAQLDAEKAAEAAAELLAKQWDECKDDMMTASLGKQADLVMHSLLPYCMGGSLDLYYYSNPKAITAVATKELCELPNEGSKNDEYDCYELVMFTRHKLNTKVSHNDNSPFGKAHSNINAILNVIARYSEEAKLNPNETCEFPAEMEDLGGKCLLFDGFAKHSNKMVKSFGLLAIIEVHRSEMDFARKNGGAKLLKKLKDKGHYPYSDLDREPVV